MSNKPWIAAAIVMLGLGLAGCGNDDEPVTQDDPVQEPATPATDATDQPDGMTTEGADEPLDTGNGATTNQAPATTLEQDTALEEETTPTGELEAPVAPDDDIPDTREDTTGTIDEPTSLPGETSEADIEQFMEETERRFEEAQRQLEQQFEEAEQQEPSTVDNTELDE